MDQNYAVVQPVEFGGVPRPRLVLKDVFNVYAGQFWRWFAITAPTSLLASVVLLLADRKIKEIFRSFPVTQISHHMLEVAGAGALRYGSFFVSWFLGCFALAAIATVVNGLDRGESGDVWISDSFQRAREHFGTLLLASIVTFGMFLAGMAVSEVIVVALVKVVGWARFSRYTTEAGFLSVLVVAGVVSWFGMAIPLIIAKDIGTWAALKRSLKISDRYEVFLLALVLESTAGTYIAWYAVHFGLTFLFPAQLTCAAWYGWLVYFVTILASAAVQPPMFIGFSLLAASEHDNSSSLPHAQQAAQVN
jgi:hypothetical protein